MVKPKLGKGKGKGWRLEPIRHALAAKGMKTKVAVAVVKGKFKTFQKKRKFKKTIKARKVEKARITSEGLPPLPTGKESKREQDIKLRLRREAISEIKLGLRPIPKTLKVEMKARQKAAIKERKKGIRKAKLKALPSKAVRGLRIKGGLARAEAIAAGLPTDESQRAKIPENRQPIF